MKYPKAYFVFFCIFILSYQLVIGQTATIGISDSLIKKFNYYKLSKPEGVLYAHFDKTIYTNDENVWFTAYLLGSTRPELNDVVSVMLVRDNDHTIALSDKFVMTDGICPGNLFLPDTIASGNYSFMLYTNDVSGGKPAHVFVQPVTVKNTTEASFKANLELLDTAESAPGGVRKIRLVTQTNSVKIIADAPVNYFLGDKNHPLISGTVKTDHAGQYIFSIPVEGIKLGNNIFEAKISYGKETKALKLVLPVFKDKPIVHFFPEGGTLSDNLTMRVGWEVKNAAGTPYKITAVLYEDAHAIDTISTNSYGMGHFWLKAHTGIRYMVKLLDKALTDSLYELPKVMDGPGITIPHALAGDTLGLVVKAKHPANVFVVLHNYREVFFSFPVKINATGRLVKINLADMPKGIATITILDSLERPCAERLFFAHYNLRSSVVIKPDKKSFDKREKVTLDLKLFDAGGNAIPGNVSIACVQANRIELKKATDIESYFYLVNNLGTLPVKENYMGNTDEDKNFLEDVLLIKGWRRYKWADLSNSTAKDTVIRQDSMKFTGTVTWYKKTLKKPANLLLFKNSSKIILSTNKKGMFSLNDASVVTAENKKLYLFVAGESNNSYEISVTDPFKKINQLMAKDYEAPNYEHFVLNQKNADIEKLNDMEHVIRLKEVKIKGSNDNSLYGGMGENACGDYVCMNNILNCPNHRGSLGNHKPVKGRMYYYNGQPGYTYLGCSIDPNDNRLMFDGIKYAMEFYPADYSQVNPPDPELLSTIYWKHQFIISPKGDNKISFYTSDVTGDFKIIVQGISANEVIYDEKTIMVQKP